jgi:hypothetical protein
MDSLARPGTSNRMRKILTRQDLSLFRLLVSIMWKQSKNWSAKRGPPSTVFGRLLLGPCLVIGRFWHAELTALVEGDLSRLKFWFPHTLSVTLIVSWLLFCKMDMAQYFLLFVLPGTTYCLCVRLLNIRLNSHHRACSCR